MKILVIEDDAEAAGYIVSGLQSKGHVVVVAEDGRRGLLRTSCEPWDLLIVDRLLPHLDGLTLVRMLRAGGIVTPVLFLTALDDVPNRIEGLRAGGDDYLAKPFALSELAARVEVLGRRSHASAGREAVLRAGPLELDLRTLTARRDGCALDLQAREFRILEYLVRNAGRVVTRTMLLENVWGFHFEPRTNLVESNISRLRSKIGAPGDELIETVRGVGYRFRVAP
jgi:two-component system OmpR family response regulator